MKIGLIFTLNFGPLGTGLASNRRTNKSNAKQKSGQSFLSDHRSKIRPIFWWEFCPWLEFEEGLIWGLFRRKTSCGTFNSPRKVFYAFPRPIWSYKNYFLCTETIMDQGPKDKLHYAWTEKSIMDHGPKDQLHCTI